MEVTLVDNALRTFENYGWGGSDKFCESATLWVSVKLNQVTGVHTKTKLENKLSSLLDLNPTADSEILCSMRIGKEKDDTEDQLQVRWASKGIHSFFFTLSPLIKKSAGLQMKIEFTDVNNFQVSQIFHLKNMVHGAYLVMSLGAAPADLVDKWTKQDGQRGIVSAKIILNLIFDEEFLASHLIENKPTDHCQLILAKMLENAENDGDTGITSAGGAVIKCHRAVLVAGSPYFEAMFHSGVLESTTNEVNMTGMTEVEVRAFLGYLYVGDVMSALENIHTAWMLLKAGNYYRMDKLANGMREILMMRGNEKYNVELALEMLSFVEKVNGISGSSGVGRETGQVLSGVWNDLKLKAVQFLKWYSKEKPMELMASEKYKKLMVETPQLAIEQYVITKADYE